MEGRTHSHSPGQATAAEQAPLYQRLANLLL